MAIKTISITMFNEGIQHAFAEASIDTNPGWYSAQNYFNDHCKVDLGNGIDKIVIKWYDNKIYEFKTR